MSLSYDKQVSMLPKIICVPEETALVFYDECVVFAKKLYKEKLLSDIQYEKIMLLDEILADMSDKNWSWVYI